MRDQLCHKPKLGHSGTFCFVAFLIVLYSCTKVDVTEVQSVYRTPYGSKYHMYTCRMIENTSAELTVKKALEQGLTPCSFCDPPVLGQSGNNIASLNIIHTRPGEKEVSTQCLGTTQKGDRCLHSSKNANGYCPQHSPE